MVYKEPTFNIKPQVKVKGWGKIYCVNTNQKKDAIIEFISDKVSSRAGKLSGIKRVSI